MFFYTIGYALLLAVVLALLFSSIFRNSGPWDNFWIYLIVLFLAIWGASLWLTPVGPVYYGIAWADLFIIGLFVALLLAAAAEASRRKYRKYPEGEEVDIVKESKKEPGAITLFGVFFWLFMAFLLAVIIIGIVNLV